MKHILITGANSYIGMSVEDYLSQWPEKYAVETVDMIDDTWREKDFSAYDTVFHVAGIAHIKETKDNADLYYKVNRDLAIATAKKAKAEGVRQFVFLSSMSIYGLNTGKITRETTANPKTSYGKSKLQAEEGIEKLRDNNFIVTIIRPPMVYGKNCKGNFQSVIKLVRKLPVFPKVKNQRSMIYIDNLCSFLKLSIDKLLNGVYFPQNSTYVGTTEMAKIIAESIGKKLYFSFSLGFAVKLCVPFLSLAQKGFGSLVYVDTEEFDYSYCVKGNSESISESI